MQLLLHVAVFVAGLAALGLEVSASRLLGTAFGADNVVWASIIGLTLVYLGVGYSLGGRLADRQPRYATFYRLMLWAGLLAGLIPFAAPAVLAFAASVGGAGVLGPALSMLLAFSLPVTLLGCVSPFAARLALRHRSEAGRVSGRLYALSTLGSILGALLPVWWFLPTLGTTMTFLVLALATSVTAIVGLAAADKRGALLYLWMPIVLGLLSWRAQL